MRTVVADFPRKSVKAQVAQPEKNLRSAEDGLRDRFRPFAPPKAHGSKIIRHVYPFPGGPGGAVFQNFSVVKGEAFRALVVQVQESVVLCIEKTPALNVAGKSAEHGAQEDIAMRSDQRGYQANFGGVEDVRVEIAKERDIEQTVVRIGFQDRREIV